MNQVGCFGFCSQGPSSRSIRRTRLYRQVKPEDAAEIVAKHVVGHEVVERLLYVEPTLKEKIHDYAKMPFYAKQERIALHGCGVIDPENIEGALGNGGYQGLAKALPG